MVKLTSPDWQEYELLDSGAGRKLERFGPFTLIRPEAQATWQPAWPDAWQAAHAIFQPASPAAGRWDYLRPMERSWIMAYKGLRFRVQASESRQVGVFPENATHWDWIDQQIAAVDRPARVLNLFGYTGLATLAAAQAGAHVTHVDASRKAVAWARANQALSGLADRPVRWIVDDALKYMQREARRGQRYDGIVLDPPAFGRGPNGEVWRFARLFPALCQVCRSVLSPAPVFLAITVYTKAISADALQQQVRDMLAGLGGVLTLGELATVERSAGRMLSNALFVRWSSR